MSDIQEMSIHEMQCVKAGFAPIIPAWYLAVGAGALLISFVQIPIIAVWGFMKKDSGSRSIIGHHPKERVAF